MTAPLRVMIILLSIRDAVHNTYRTVGLSIRIQIVDCNNFFFGIKIMKYSAINILKNEST